MTRAETITRRFDAKASGRSDWERGWQDVSEYVLPQRGEFQARGLGATGGNPGRQRGSKVIDATARDRCMRAAAAIGSLLTGQELPFFRLVLGAESDPDLKDDPAVTLWLQRVSAVLFALLARPLSGFQAAADELYLDLLGFGTSVMFVPETIWLGSVFQTLHMSECHLDTDAEGRVVGLYRDYQLRAWQAIEFFGAAALPETITEAADSPTQHNRQFRFLHAVFKRSLDPAPPKGPGGALAYASVYIATESKTIVRDGGFPEFPFMTPRWRKMPGEDYGRSPAMDVMPAIKLLNTEKKTTVRSAQKMVDPPLQMPDDGFMDAPNMNANAINEYRAGMSPNDRITPILTGGRPEIGIDMMGLEIEIIDRAFMMDLLVTPLQDRMTATETLQRRDEQFRQAAPMVGRSRMEFAAPTIERLLAIGVRMSQAQWSRGRDGLFPLPPPALLRSGDIQADFIGPIGTAQKRLIVENTDRVLDTVDRVAVYDPGIGDLLNGERMVRGTAGAQGLPADMLNSPDEVAALRQSRAEQEAAAQQAELQATQAGTVKDIAQAAAAAGTNQGLPAR